MRVVRFVCIFSTLVTTLALAQTNPVPFVNQPVVPSSVAPGGPSFTLMVNGAGFVSGSAVNWNGTALPTTYVSNSQLNATVPATDIASSGTAWITVWNPSPGGGTSNVAFLQISNSGPLNYTDLSSVVFLSPAGYPEPFGIGWSIGPITADFNNDRKLDMLVFDVLSGQFGQQGSGAVLLGNGDGTFNVNCCNLSYLDSPPMVPDAVAIGDFNGDGKLDIILDAQDYYTSDYSTVIMLGNGDGTFQSASWSTGDGGFSSLLVGDFNGDGNLDLVGVGTYPFVFLGNGDGTFRISAALSLASVCGGVGDYNGDGKLDLLECNTQGVGVAAGNGDGTFQNPSTFFPIGFSPSQLAAYDLNGDGKLDLVAVGGLTVAVLMGNGDGTFQPPASYPVCSSLSGALQFVVSDFNSDGKLDIAVFDSQGHSCISLGNGDGTFQASENFVALSGEQSGSGVVEGDFNGDGRPDLAAGLTATTNTITSQESLSALVLLDTGGLAGTSTSLALSQSTIAVVLTATVSPTSGSGVPTGTVTFFNGTTQIGTGTLSSGVATYDYNSSTLAVGVYLITASYGGSSSFSASSTSQALTVAATGTNLLLSPASVTSGSTGPVVMMATVGSTTGAGMPTGIVTFFNGTTQIGTGTLSSGGATYNYNPSTLAVGVYSITASYGGDSNFSASTSAPQTLTVTGVPTYTLSVSPTSLTIAAGQSGQATFTVTPQDGFNSQVSFACSGLPHEASCSFNPSSVTPSGSRAVTSTLTLSTTAPGAAARRAASVLVPRPIYALMLFPVLVALLGASGRKKRGRLRILALLVVLGFGAALTSCGGGSSSGSGAGGGNSGTPTGTSTVTVTASTMGTGAISQTASLTVTITQ